MLFAQQASGKCQRKNLCKSLIHNMLRHKRYHRLSWSPGRVCRLFAFSRLQGRVVEQARSKPILSIDLSASNDKQESMTVFQGDRCPKRSLTSNRSMRCVDTFMNDSAAMKIWWGISLRSKRPLSFVAEPCVGCNSSYVAPGAFGLVPFGRQTAICCTSTTRVVNDSIKNS